LDEAGMEKLNFAMQTVSSSISSIGSLMASITERNKKVIQEQVEAGVISQEQADKKLEQIERKAFKRQKAIQIATATANAAQGVLAALAQTTDPTPTQSLRVANAAMIGILGAIQVATVAAQKFQDGGLIQGASHSQGGVPFSVAGRGGFEAEGGEYIVKKSTVDNYGVDFMNALNNMKLPKMFAEGGYVAPTPVGTISDQVSRGVSELVSVTENRQLQVINVEQDFTKLQTKVSNVEQARTY
jgi:polyhydroxyalkanoate synthesis regulator phasin